MTHQEIVYTALDNLWKQTEITGRWLASGVLDGQVVLAMEGRQTTYHVEINNDLRSAQLEKMERLNKEYAPFLVVARRLIPKVKEELRRQNIAYLEANGNIFLKNNGGLLWIDTNQPIPASEKINGRAFTKTGLKVVFQFLLEEAWINKPYRQIAAQTGTGIGNITNIITGLKQDGFLLPVTKNEYKLNNKKALLDKWATAYDQRLKPALKIGTFRFLKEETFNNWRKLPVRKGEAWWGGEPAGDLLTNHLKPGLLTIYTTASRSGLIRRYGLIPDEGGNIKVYQKFWQAEDVKDNVVPPLLAYADLITQADRRCAETAQKIYEKFLQDKL